MGQYQPLFIVVQLAAHWIFPCGYSPSPRAWQRSGGKQFFNSQPIPLHMQSQGWSWLGVIALAPGGRGTEHLAHGSAQWQSLAAFVNPEHGKRASQKQLQPPHPITFDQLMTQWLTGQETNSQFNPLNFSPVWLHQRNQEICICSDPHHAMVLGIILERILPFKDKLDGRVLQKTSGMSFLEDCSA